jgi:hypothetical protein
MKKYYVVIAIALLILAFAGIVLFTYITRVKTNEWLCVNNQWVKKGNPSYPKPNVPCKVAVVQHSFYQSGTLIDFESVTNIHAGSWTLLFNQPGNPAAKVGLIFNKDSKCDMHNGKGQVACDTNSFGVGNQVYIMGDYAGTSANQVTVVLLKRNL